MTGRKGVQNGLVRYGSYIAVVDPDEPFDQLLGRLSLVSYANYRRERQNLKLTLSRICKEYRFQHHTREYLANLEQR
jgi:hypothetical protein